MVGEESTDLGGDAAARVDAAQPEQVLAVEGDAEAD